MLFCQKSSLYLSDKQKNVYYLSFFIVPNYLCVVKELIGNEQSHNTDRVLNLPDFVQLCATSMPCFVQLFMRIVSGVLFALCCLNRHEICYRKLKKSASISHK